MLHSCLRSRRGEGQRLANENPDAVRTAIGQYTKIPAPVTAKTALPTWTNKQDVDGLKVIAELTKKYADIDKLVNAEPLILKTT